ncbi:IclR family transcriptional regulator [Microbacterium sp. NPDC056234]|uniref:IclR family transcriptional regulator n=1 Tax=Microbacterium sp. NPDC056234 TaxID=3345757 RepID=UPI0035DDBD1C
MAATPPQAPASQTLSRGIRILEVLADERGPLTIDDVAARLRVHRSVAYRLLRTLEEHGLVSRDSGGRVQLGTGLAALAAGVAHDLQAEALPELTVVANELGATSFLAVLDHDECVTLVSVEPRHAINPVAQRPGTRHLVTRGAPGKAILTQLGAPSRPRLPSALAEELDIAAARGYATSHDEVIPTLRSVAVPLVLRGRAPAAIAVVFVASSHDDDAIAARLTHAAEAVREALGG